jgi:Na+-driven multidrug efflux pump
MVVIGLTQGMQPIAGYNHGAQKTDRVIKVFRYTVIAATCVTTTGFLMAECIPRLIARAFTSNPELIAFSTTGLRLVSAAFPVVGFQIVTSSLFQSIGQARIAIFLSLSRQVVMLIPSLFIMPGFFGLNGVWAAIPASDLLATVLTYIVLKIQVRKFRARALAAGGEIGETAVS